MKKILRNLARRFFKKWIRVYNHEYFIALEMAVHMDKGIMEVVRHEIAVSFAKKMLEEGLIEFEEEEDIKSGGRIIRSKIRVI